MNIRLSSFLLLAGLALLFSMPGAMSESGGPDSFGYTFKDSNETDGPTNNWIDVSSNGTAINMTSEGPGDAVVGPYELGFKFFFYGEWYSQWWLHGDNGAITFSQPEDMTSSWTPHNFSGDWQDSNPEHDIDMVGAFKTDLGSHNCTNATLSYKTIGNAPSRALVIEYENFNTYNYGSGGCTSEEYGTYNFQIILFEESGDILFQYDNDYSNGTDYVSDGAPPFNHAGIGIQGSANAGIGYYYDVISDNITNQAVRFYSLPSPVLDLAISDLRYNIPISYNFNERITATIMNRGSANQTNFNVSFKISNSDDIVLINDTRNIEFIERYGSRIVVEYVAPTLVSRDFEINDNITITVSLVISDENISNNAIHGEAKIRYMFFKENFEEGTWNNSEWDFSESQAWNYTIDTNGDRTMFSGYRCSQAIPVHSSIISPSFDLTIGKNVWMKFSHSHYFYYLYDGAHLQISTGSGFTTIEPEGGYPNIIYNYPYYGNPLRGQPGWTSYSNYDDAANYGWVYGTDPTEVVFNLSAYVGYSDVKLRWSVGFSTVPCSPSIYNSAYGFDNLIIYENGIVYNQDLELVAIESDSFHSWGDYSLISNDNIEIAANLMNKGINDIDLENVVCNLQIYYLDDGDSILHFSENLTRDGTLLSGNRIDYLFGHDFSSMTGYFVIRITVNFEEDQDLSDNMLLKDIRVLNLLKEGPDSDWKGWESWCQDSICENQSPLNMGGIWYLENSIWRTGEDVYRDTYNGDDTSLVSPTFDFSNTEDSFLVFEHTYSFYGQWDIPGQPDYYYDGGRVEICYGGSTACQPLEPTDGVLYNGVVYDYGYYGNPLSGQSAFVGSGNGITIIDLEEALSSIDESNRKELFFRFRLGGCFPIWNPYWSISNVEVYASGMEMEGIDLENPHSVHYTEDFEIITQYGNTGTETIDSAYVRASIYNESQDVYLIGYKTIENLLPGDSATTVFELPGGLQYPGNYEINISLLAYNDAYDLQTECLPNVFTSSSNPNWVEHSLDNVYLSYYFCANKLIPFADINGRNNELKGNLVAFNQAPTVALSEESRNILGNSSILFIEGQDNYVGATGEDLDGFISSFVWSSSESGIFSSTSTANLGTLGAGPHLIVLYSQDNFGKYSDPINFNLEILPDTDRDGIIDEVDVFPYDSLEWIDSDDDGVGDNGDPFPSNSAEWMDSDNDGVGDNEDLFPHNSEDWIDSDGDGVGDNGDPFPSNSAEWSDTDDDGVGNNGDVFPFDPEESADTDSDGVGDNADVFPKDPEEWIDSDGDGVGDNSDIFPDNGIVHTQWQIWVIVLSVLVSGAAVNHGYHLFTLSSRVSHKMDMVRTKITEFKEKGVNTDELEKILKKAENDMKKWN